MYDIGCDDNCHDGSGNGTDDCDDDFDGDLDVFDSDETTLLYKHNNHQLHHYYH